MDFGANFYHSTAISSTSIKTNKKSTNEIVSTLLYKKFKSIKNHKKNEKKAQICNQLKHHIKRNPNLA